ADERQVRGLALLEGCEREYPAPWMPGIAAPVTRLSSVVAALGAAFLRRRSRNGIAAEQWD
ncbi:MAG: hypothetical protein KGL43_25985, partial [Burkholderiales bacterium]|nr:hypothetical protein [Burkholderiales bacterium]